MMGNIKYVLNAILVTVSQEFHVVSYFLARYSDIFLIEKSIKWHKNLAEYSSEFIRFVLYTVLNEIMVYSLIKYPVYQTPY